MVHERGHRSPLALEERHRPARALDGQDGRLPGAVEVRARRIGPVQDRERGIPQGGAEPSLELGRGRDLPELDHQPSGGSLARGDFKRVFDLFPVLEHRRDQQAGTLSGGEQQMLALARALAARPRLLMLDEPSLGLAPIVVEELFRIVGELNREEGLTVLVVEQNANAAFSVADRAYVLEVGRVAVQGPSAELREDENVRRSYLGY